MFLDNKEIKIYKLERNLITRKYMSNVRYILIR